MCDHKRRLGRNLQFIYEVISMTSMTVVILLALTNIQLNICAAETPSIRAPNVNTHIPNLPDEHLLRYLNTFPKIREQCEQSTSCELPKNASALKLMPCWGHEDGCNASKRFQTPTCPGEHVGWGTRSKAAQVNTFYLQADFGYIQQQIGELSLMCQPSFITDSSLECTKYLRFCRGRNILLDLRDLVNRKELIRYHMDVLKPGQILGHCELNRTRLSAEMDHMGALQSWAPELRNFDEIPMPVLASEKCDLIINTPTFLMKIDATFNMYHHFCDFFNLYASLFVNQSHPLAFSTDIRIIIWETYPYESPFYDTFKAFSEHPIWTLNELKGKRVCFRNLVFPLLPRMIFGLFYNTPLIHGCQNSGLFRAFSEFILHRLEIPLYPPPPEKNKVRVTYLSRQTKYRRVLNEEELLNEIRKDKTLQVQKVSFERDLGFIEQLEIMRNTDVLIGIHGAGLTHLLFLPNWGTIFELYNCEDPNCYKDLARLRGVNYLTWERENLVYPEDEGHHPQGGAHAKFTNYEFDLKEFARLVQNAAEYAREHNEFQEYHTKNNAEINAERDEL